MSSSASFVADDNNSTYLMCCYDPCRNPKCNRMHRGSNVRNGTAVPFIKNPLKKRNPLKTPEPGSVPVICKFGTKCTNAFITCKFCHSDGELRVLMLKRQEKKEKRILGLLRKQQDEAYQQQLKAQQQVEAHQIMCFQQMQYINANSLDKSLLPLQEQESQEDIIKTIQINGIPLQIIEDELKNLQVLANELNENLSDDKTISNILHNYREKLNSSISNIQGFYNGIVEKVSKLDDAEANALDDAEANALDDADKSK